MQNIILSIEEANSIIEYLSSKPYVEVYKIISMIQNKYLQQQQSTSQQPSAPVMGEPVEVKIED